MSSKKVKVENPVEQIQSGVVVAASEVSPFQRNEKLSPKKKMTPYLLMLLTYSLVTGDTATEEEIEQVKESQPFIKITDAQKAELIEMGVIEVEGGKIYVTKAGEALVLKGTTFGVNFDRLLDGLSFNGLIGLCIKCGNTLANQLRQPITIKNKKGEDSEVSIGIREVMHRLYQKIEWPEEQ